MSASQSDKDKKQTGTTAQSESNAAGTAADKKKPKVVSPFSATPHTIQLKEEDVKKISELKNPKYIPLGDNKLLIAESGETDRWYGKEIHIAIVDMETADVLYQTYRAPQGQWGNHSVITTTVLSVSPNLFALCFGENAITPTLQEIYFFNVAGKYQFRIIPSDTKIEIRNLSQLQILSFPQSENCFAINADNRCCVLRKSESGHRYFDEELIQSYQSTFFSDSGREVFYDACVSINAKNQLTVFQTLDTQNPHSSTRDIKKETQADQYEIDSNSVKKISTVKREGHVLKVDFHHTDVLKESPVRDGWWINGRTFIYYREGNQMKSIPTGSVRCLHWLPEGVIVGMGEQDKMYQIKIQPDKTLLIQSTGMKWHVDNLIDWNGNLIALDRISEGKINIYFNMQRVREIQDALIAAAMITEYDEKGDPKITLRIDRDSAGIIADYVGMTAKRFAHSHSFVVTDRKDIPDDLKKEIKKRYQFLVREIKQHESNPSLFRFFDSRAYEANLKQKSALEYLNELLKDENSSIKTCVEKTREQFPDEIKLILKTDGHDFAKKWLGVKLKSALEQEEKNQAAAAAPTAAATATKKSSN